MAVDARRGAIIAAGALAALSTLWHGLLLPPTAVPRALAVAWMGAPAVLAAVGAWRGGRVAFAAAGFVALLYFTHGTMELVANPPVRLLALAECALALALLGASAHALRRAAAPASGA